MLNYFFSRDNKRLEILSGLEALGLEFGYSGLLEEGVAVDYKAFYS